MHAVEVEPPRHVAVEIGRVDGHAGEVDEDGVDPRSTEGRATCAFVAERDGPALLPSALDDASGCLVACGCGGRPEGELVDDAVGVGSLCVGEGVSHLVGGGSERGAKGQEAPALDPSGGGVEGDRFAGIEVHRGDCAAPIERIAASGPGLRLDGEVGVSERIEIAIHGANGDAKVEGQRVSGGAPSLVLEVGGDGVQAFDSGHGVVG